MSISSNSPDPIASNASIITMKEQHQDLSVQCLVSIAKDCRAVNLMYIEIPKNNQTQVIKQVIYKLTMLSWNTCLMRKSYDLEHYIKTIINFSFSKGLWKIVLLLSLVGLDSVREILQSPRISKFILVFIVCHTLLLVPMTIVLSSLSSSSSFFSLFFLFSTCGPFRCSYSPTLSHLRHLCCSEYKHRNIHI